MIIEATSLSKFYGIVVGLNDVTISLKPGVQGLLGPNGAGKSTFMNILTGQLRPTEGSIRVLGESPWNNPSLFRRVGFCPEQDALYSNLTGLEFVTLLARLHGYDRSEAARRARAMLELVELGGAMGRRIGTYSRGMRQRAKLAQALVHDPELLILDEPLSGLDPVGRILITGLIKQFAADGRSILISSHVLHEVESMTEEFVLIYGGRIIASGNVHEIRSLLDRHPHRIQLHCKPRQKLAQALVGESLVAGVEFGDEPDALTILTHDRRSLYTRLPALALETRVSVSEMTSKDDNLEAVFRYLIGEEDEG